MTGTIAETLANNLPIGLALLALALYVFTMRPEVVAAGPKVRFHVSNDGGATWNHLGSIG